MATLFNFHEVYEMGLQIEQNGLAFYRRFADNVKENSAKILLKGLAEWEERHASQFKELRDEEAVRNPSVAKVDKDSEAAAYLRSLADAHVFLRSFDIEDLAAKLVSTRLVLEKALQFEKDSVKLYESLLTVIPDELGKSAVKKLADEEVKHVEMLSKELASL
jgi:rubrerythrin